MYYKVIKNNSVVDALINPSYVYRNPKNGVVMRCSNAEDGLGVISYDGSTVYQIKGRSPLHGDYEEVYLEEITETEYLELREIFDSYEPENPDEGGTENPPEENPETPDNPDEPPVNPERPMSATEMTVRIKELEEQLAATKILLGVE